MKLCQDPFTTGLQPKFVCQCTGWETMTYKESFGDRLEAFSSKYLNKFYIPAFLVSIITYNRKTSKEMGMMIQTASKNSKCSICTLP